MGLAKNQMIEDEERGWHDPEGHVCSQCVQDEFLKDEIRKNATRKQCDYCGHRTPEESAAPVSELMAVIADAVSYYFAEPTNAGVPYDKGWGIEPIDTVEMLMSLPLDCHDDLFEDIASAFTNECWVPAADGHWASSHSHEVLRDSWASFEQVVKHDVRFLFQDLPAPSFAGPQEFRPGRMLPALGKGARELGLVKSLSTDLLLFRVREREPMAAWALNADQLGAPPPRLARAGRMNPAGISYLYLALEEQTAIAEVLGGPPCGAAVATFGITRELSVLDLVNLPEKPSIFDAERRAVLETLLFFEGFVGAISKPVRKDGMEHVEYVPSQVVSEYFATAFRTDRDGTLDGIMYPSAVRSGGRNLVLFPTERGLQRRFDQARFQSAREAACPNWDALTAAIL